MYIGIQMSKNKSGNRETDTYCAFVKPRQDALEIEFVYTEDPRDDQDSGWIVLNRDEAVRLAHAIISVADNLTSGEQASFMVDRGELSAISVGK